MRARLRCTRYDAALVMLGAAQDRERAKRERGQSSIGSWKSEAEMVLRQQYDS